MGSVEFLTFIGDLVNGRLKANVNASVQQMEAYAEMLRNIAKSPDDFIRNNHDG